MHFHLEAFEVICLAIHGKQDRTLGFCRLDAECMCLIVMLLQNVDESSGLVDESELCRSGLTMGFQ
jgi:hypothetical protein